MPVLHWEAIRIVLHKLARRTVGGIMCVMSICLQCMRPVSVESASFSLGCILLPTHNVAFVDRPVIKTLGITPDFQIASSRTFKCGGKWRYYPQSSSTLWNYSKCGVYTVESEAGC
jgi:hypothetical protein